jgi:flagellar biosynthesis GTPase FlhF
MTNGCKKSVCIKGVEYKECTCCHTLLVVTEFYVKNYTKEGKPIYKTKCKRCVTNDNKNKRKSDEIGNKLKLRDKIRNQNAERKAWRKEYENKEDVKERNNANQRKRFQSIEKKLKKKAYDSQQEIRDRENERKRKARHDPTKRDKLLTMERDHFHSRRGLGNDCINESLINGDYHHLGTDPFGNHDPDTTVWCPRKIHGSGHYLFAPKLKIHGQGMLQKNIEICKWYQETYPDDNENISYLQQVVEATQKRVDCGWENAPLWKEWLEYKVWLDDNEYMTFKAWLSE